MATEVDRLVVVFDANFARMEEKLNKVIRSNQRAATKVEQSWSKDMFSGATKALPGVGSSLLAIVGPAAAAAAAVGAVTAALHGAVAAVEFADEIGDTADRLHVSTDALQEYRIAIRLAGGETKGADEALESFSQNLGKAKEGLAKSVQAFHAVGIEPEQIKSFKTADEALQSVVKHMEGLSDAEKDAVIQQFGLGGLKQLIDGGTASMDEFMRKARESGEVIDSDLIARSGELNDQFEHLHGVIGTELKSALIDLAPVITSLLTLMAEFAKLAAEIVDSFKKIEDKSTVGLKRNRAGLVREIQRYGLKEIGGGKLLPGDRQVLDWMNKRVGEIDAELSSRAKENEAAGTTPYTPPKTLQAKGSGSAKAKAAKALTGKAVEAISVADPEQQGILDALDYWRGVEEKLKELQAEKPFEFEGMTPAEDTVQKWNDVFDSAQRDLHDGVKAGIMGGLEAGFRDGLPGVLDYLQDALMKSVLDSVAEGLTQAVLSGSKGGNGGLLTSLASALFGPKYAAGTLSSKHGLALVGERGPELVNLPGGSQVISNAKLRNVGMGGGKSATQTVVFDNRGAVIWEEAAKSMMSYADRAAASSGLGAVNIARRATPDDLAKQNGRRLG